MLRGGDGAHERNRDQGTADTDGDGIDDIGLWVPDRSGATPLEGSEWYFLLSGDRPITERIVDFEDFDGELTVEFTPDPFGDDLFIQFGDDFGVPIVGNFDPPLIDDIVETPEPSVVDTYDGRFHNTALPADVDGSGIVTLGDALAVVSDLRTHGPRMLYNASDVSWKVDVNGDTATSVSDALEVVARLRSGGGGEGEGESAAAAEEAAGKKTINDAPASQERKIEAALESAVDSAVVALLAEMNADHADPSEAIPAGGDSESEPLDDLVAELAND